MIHSLISIIRHKQIPVQETNSIQIALLTGFYFFYRNYLTTISSVKIQQG